MREWKREVFYDQGGALSERFHVPQSPAVVTQEGKRLRVDEIRLLSSSAACGLVLVCRQPQAATCKGKFANPITDICWSCMFPLRIAGLDLLPGSGETPPIPAGIRSAFAAIRPSSASRSVSGSRSACRCRPRSRSAWSVSAGSNRSGLRCAGGQPIPARRAGSVVLLSGALVCRSDHLLAAGHPRQWLSGAAGLRCRLPHRTRSAVEGR